MSSLRDYSSLKYIISQSTSKDKQSSYSLPKDYSAHKNRQLVQNKNLSTCELISNVSNENDLEEIYLDNDEINELKNGLRENQINLSNDSETSTASSLISIPPSISLLERLIRTHPIWLLTNLERSEVTRLLQGKESGSFIVRSSSKPGTMALSVRLPKAKGPYIQHYIIENLGNRKLHLEGSQRFFSVIPMLISHYCQCLDELPVLLKLPEIVLNASRRQLNSLSLLSDKFWTTNFDEQNFSISSDSERENFNEKLKDQLNEHFNEQNNNDLIQEIKNNSLKSNKSSIDETKELMFDTEDDEDHNFIKKEVFQSESECDGELSKLDNLETEVKKHFLMQDDNDEKVEDRIENELDGLMKLKLNENGDTKENNLNQSPLKPLKPPPRKNLNSDISISPPPLPSRDLKPSKDHEPLIKNYFKVASLSYVEANETTSTNQLTNGTKPSIEHTRKKSVQSNLNLLIDFDVLEEEEKLIEQLKENDIFNLNVINAQTQQLLSSQVSGQLNSDNSSVDLSNAINEPLLDDQKNITKIEVNTDSKLQELNLIELKVNKSRDELVLDELEFDSLQDHQQLKLCSANDEKKVELLIEPIIETESIEPLIGQIGPMIGQQSSLIRPLVAQKLESNNEDRPKMKTKKIKLTKPKVDTKDCGIQTDSQSILYDSKLESYRNFLVYDYVPNLKNHLTKDGNDLSMFTDQIYSTNEEKDLFYYQHFFKRNHQNQSNPSLNQFTSNQLTKTHSFESLYVTYDALYSKQTNFFERYIVPTNSNLSDVCLQVGDGLIPKQEEQPPKIPELVTEERVKLDEKKKPTMKDVHSRTGWALDSSNWQWQSSDEEELTNSIVNTENISTKYRRYSCKYIIESGVESDSDGELNEDGLQSMLNDNVRLDGLNATSDHFTNNKAKLKNVVEKANSPMILIDNEEPCSSGFFESNRPLQNETKKQKIDLKQKECLIATNQKSTKRTNKNNRTNDDTEEDDDEMVFQEIELDIYTTNDELDDNQSIDRIEEEIYTITARNLTYSTVAKSISEYIFELFRLNDNVFAKSINNFIECTKELYESNPLIIMRNIRQFMNGIKNYLVKNGEKEFLDFVKHERKRLKPEEIIDLEAIITNCLHKLVIKPLKEFIYQKFISMEFKFGHESYMKLNENISFLSTRLPEEFEISNAVRLPNNKHMKRIAKFFAKLQSTYSPLKKLEYILSIVSIINFNTKLIDRKTIDGKVVAINKQRIDERTFISVFIYLLVKFNVVNIEIEIDYIWSLLPPSLINGEACYYLNLVYSCVYSLKINFSICQERAFPLNTIEIQRSMITSYLPSINDSLNAKCKSSLYQKEISNNLVLRQKIIDHPDLNLKNLKHSKKRNHTYNQNINELTLVNSNFVQSYPSALNNYKQDSFFRAHIVQNDNLSLKLSSLFTICCLKILILDEFTGNICCKLIAVKPEMNSKELIKLLAQKFSIFNSEDYSLFLLTHDGKEFLIDENELPFSIKVNGIKYGMKLSFVFKRADSQYVFSNKFYELNLD